jgi:hypothetical protein
VLQGVIQLTSAEEFQRPFFNFKFFFLEKKKKSLYKQANKNGKSQGKPVDFGLVGFITPLCVCVSLLYLGIFGDVVISEDEVGILIVSFPSMWKKSLENNQTQPKTESDIPNLITHSSDVTLCVCVQVFPPFWLCY